MADVIVAVVAMEGEAGDRRRRGDVVLDRSLLAACRPVLFRRSKVGMQESKLGNRDAGRTKESVFI